MTNLELAGSQEVAELLSVSRQRVHQLSLDAGFPQPVADLAAGLIWRKQDIVGWMNETRGAGDPANRPEPPPRDPERPQDDPWDANAVRYLLDLPGGEHWKRGPLMECLREQPKRLKSEPKRVRSAAELARRHGVDRYPDSGGKTIHFFRTDPMAPAPYPASAFERRQSLKN